MTAKKSTMALLYFEDFTVGRVTMVRDTYRVSEEEIIELGERFDPQPFHIDPVAAADTHFGGIVASSVHVFAMFVRIGILEEPADALSALGFNNMKMLAPIRPGDVLSKKETVTAARHSKSRPGCGIVETYSEMFNQDGTLVFSVDCALLVRCRPA